MSTLDETRELFNTVTPTRFDRVYIGMLKPYKERKFYRIITGDDSGDYGPTGPSYRTKLEAMADLPRVVSEYYGGAR